MPTPAAVRFLVAAACGFSLILLLALCTVVPATAAIQEGVAEQMGTSIAYAVPGSPLNLAYQAPGRVWYTAPDEDGIGALVVRAAPARAGYNYLVNFLALPGSEPFDIAYTPDAIWFTARGANQLGRINLISDTLAITAPTALYDLPTPGSAPAGLTVAEDGAIWLVEQRGGKLARFDPISQTFTEFPFPTDLFCFSKPPVCVPDPAAFDITVREDEVWFTVPNADSAVAYSIRRNSFFRAHVGAGSQPAAVVIDNNGRPWVTAYASNLVARYAPGTLDLWIFYASPTPNSGPKGLAYRGMDRINEIWYTEQKAGKVGRISSVSNTRTVFFAEFVASPQSQPSGITVTPDGHVWFTERVHNRLVELRPPYFANLFPAVHLGR